MGRRVGGEWGMSGGGVLELGEAEDGVVRCGWQMEKLGWSEKSLGGVGWRIRGLGWGRC